MPQRRSAIKEIRKIHKRRLHNLDIKTDLKRSTKTYLAAINDKKADEAKDLLKTLFKKLDKAAKRNIMHQNTAARRKSRYSKMIKSLS